MITRFVIAGLLFVALSSGLSFAFDDEGPVVSAEPGVEEIAPETPGEAAPADAPPSP